MIARDGLPVPWRLCASIPRSPCLRRHVSEMMDRINKRSEDVKQSVTAADEIQGTRTTYRVFNRRSSAFIGA